MFSGATLLTKPKTRDNVRTMPSQCPTCGGALVPTTMKGVTRCDNWPACDYMGGLERIRRGRREQVRCKHNVTRMTVRMNGYKPVEMQHVCEACGRTVGVPSDVVIDYRGGTLRVVRAK
jgi:hypothetical protein